MITTLVGSRPSGSSPLNAAQPDARSSLAQPHSPQINSPSTSMPARIFQRSRLQHKGPETDGFRDRVAPRSASASSPTHVGQPPGWLETEVRPGVLLADISPDGGTLRGAFTTSARATYNDR